MPVISHLHIYPVKSMQGIMTEEAELTVRGLKYDRNWMVVSEDGRFLTQRRLTGLATIRVDITHDQLKFLHSSGDSFAIPLHDDNYDKVTVEIWGDLCEAFDEGAEVSAWLTRVLGNRKEENLRLVRFKETFRREVDKNYLQEEDSHTAFSDSFPFLVTNKESLNRLNEHLMNAGSEPVNMNRFRPNIVMKGLEPFEENRFDELVSPDGRYRLGLRKPCKRCKITTIDQHTGQIADHREPLRTLALMNTVSDRTGAYFGQNAILLSGAGNKIRRGDQVLFEVQTRNTNK